MAPPNGLTNRRAGIAARARLTGSPGEARIGASSPAIAARRRRGPGKAIPAPPTPPVRTFPVPAELSCCAGPPRSQVARHYHHPGGSGGVCVDAQGLPPDPTATPARHPRRRPSGLPAGRPVQGGRPASRSFCPNSALAIEVCLSTCQRRGMIRPAAGGAAAGARRWKLSPGLTVGYRPRDPNRQPPSGHRRQVRQPAPGRRPGHLAPAAAAR